MAHNLIIGMTESGKTTLAKWLCEEFFKREIETAVLDPLNDPGWVSSFVTSDSAKFLEHVRKRRSCMVFVDEGATSIGRYNEQMEWLATQSRHWGHSCFFISQRAVQMSSTIRHQCSRAFIFAVGEIDSKMFAEEWREPELKNLQRIQKGEFVVVSRFDAIRFGKLDWSNRSVYIDESPESVATPAPAPESKERSPEDDKVPDSPE